MQMDIVRQTNSHLYREWIVNRDSNIGLWMRVNQSNVWISFKKKNVSAQLILYFNLPHECVYPSEAFTHYMQMKSKILMYTVCYNVS